MIATVLKKKKGSGSVKTRTDLDTDGLKVMDPSDPEHSWKIFRKWSTGTVPCIYVVMDPCDDTLEDPLFGGDGDGVAGNKLCHLIPGLRTVLPMLSSQKLGRITQNRLKKKSG